MKLEIHAARPSDHAVIAGFQLQMALESEGIALDPTVLASGVQAVFNDPGKGQYLVAAYQGTVIASLMITYEWSDWRNGMVWWIQSVYVDKQYRGQGVFRQMYHYLKTKVQEDPGLRGLRLYVDQQNLPAIGVYHSLGMNGDHYRVFEWMKA